MPTPAATHFEQSEGRESLRKPSSRAPGTCLTGTAYSPMPIAVAGHPGAITHLPAPNSGLGLSFPNAHK